MRARNIKNKKEILENSNYVINDPNKCIGNWNKEFKNNNSIYLEIGIGKGKFIYEMAKNNKDINFIGIERIDTILTKAVQNIEKKEKLDNLKLINFDAEKINELFNGEIKELYLNFSDPWPKKRHEKRRLTSLPFLKKYDIIFSSDKIVNFKTDNRELFEYSVVSLSEYNYIIKDISLDLHKKENFNNITTEYEEKFSKKGFNICYLRAIKK